MATIAQVPQDRPYIVGLASSFTPYGTYTQAQTAAVALSAANASAAVYTASVEEVVQGGSPAAAATGTYTITGAPTTGDNNVYTIAGTAVSAPQTTGNTVTQQAAADVLVINANATVNKLVSASSALGVVTITAIASGTGGNAITTTAASTGDVLTANQAALSGGAITPTIAGGRIDLQPGAPQTWIVQLAATATYLSKSLAESQAFVTSAANSNAGAFVARTFQTVTGP